MVRISRIFSLGAALVIFSLPFSLPLAAAEQKEKDIVDAPRVLLIDYDSNSVLYEKNADQLAPPASLTKLMTMAVVFREIREGRLKLEDELEISENAWRRGGAPAGGSTMYAEIHSKVSVENLIRGAIIDSANDACIVFAEAIAGGEAAFAGKMNELARELGLTQSSFTNPTGLPDPEQKSSPRDLARLARHLIKTYPEFYTIFGQREFTWNKIRQQNRNPLLSAGIGVDGMKTGHINDSGYGLVASAQQNDQRLITVVMGAKNAKERADDAKKLLEWGFRSFVSRKLFDEEEIVGTAKVFGGTTGSVALVGAGPVRVLFPRVPDDRLTARIVYSGPVMAPIEKGQQIGQLVVRREDRVVLETPLYAKEAVGTGSLPNRAFDVVSELFLGVVRLGWNRL